MTQAADLNRLSVAEKDALILALSSQLAAAQATIAAQEARIAGLEARLEQLTRPPKTPDNSSKPPSRGQKRDRSKSDGERPPRKSRPGVGRTLHPDPDRVVDATLTHCPKCLATFPDAAQSPQQVYDRIELPPIKPDVTRVCLFGAAAPAAARAGGRRPPSDWSPVRRLVARSRRW